MKFYETFYSSNQMALAVVAPQSLPQLRKFVLDAFGDIPNRQIDRPEDKWAFKIPPYVAGKSVIPAEKTILEILVKICIEDDEEFKYKDNKDDLHW